MSAVSFGFRFTWGVTYADHRSGNDGFGVHWYWGRKQGFLTIWKWKHKRQRVGHEEYAGIFKRAETAPRVSLEDIADQRALNADIARRIKERFEDGK